MSYAIRDALASFRRSPALTALSASMIALSLFVVGLFGVAAHNIGRVLDQIESRVEIIAYLRDDARPDAVELALDEIRAYPEVLEALYVSREQALEVARQELPEFRTLFAELDANPLPASFEIRLHPGQRDAHVVRDVANRVEFYPFVEDVNYGHEWVEKIYLLRRIAGAAALIVGVAFAAVATLIISSAVRMAIFARRNEISIMQLVGATNGFIRRPFLIEGLLTGLLGSGLALLLTYGIYRFLASAVFELEWLPDAWMLGGVAAGGIFGVFASASAVRRHLRAL